MSDTIDFDTWLKINALLQSYCEAIDGRDAELLAMVFAKDAVLDLSPDVQVSGRTAIVKGTRTMFENKVQTSHHIGTPRLSRNEDGWGATTYAIVANRPPTGPGYTMYGRYEDLIIQEASSFVIKSRKIICHVVDGDGPDRNWLLP